VDSILLGCDAVLKDNLIPTFRKKHAASISKDHLALEK
jgi:hypothetical protein